MPAITAKLLMDLRDSDLYAVKALEIALMANEEHITREQRETLMKLQTRYEETVVELDRAIREHE